MNILDETRIRITLFLSFTNLNDDKQWIWHTTYTHRKFKIDIAQLGKVFNEPPVGLKQRINKYDKGGREILNETP